MKSFILIATGRVQGVYFRATAKNQAQSLAITGEVKNLKNGTVQLMISGKDEDLQKFIEWCLKGSAGANVKQLSIHQIDPMPFDQFRIIR